jgi:16S rRNA (cytidine1402-2'-O)-methyltransferase
VPVLPLPGASSLLLALAASGLNGQSFAFVGYLPQEAAARTARIRELEALSRRLGQTQLVIETPYRNAALLEALLAGLAPATRLSVSCGLTLPGGWTRTDGVAGWRSKPPQMPDRWPAVFAWLAS